MFDLIIMLSRYLFIFYIVLFLWQGIVYVAYEQGTALFFCAEKFYNFFKFSEKGTKTHCIVI